jgi:CheY-like chemotaxis protein
MPARTSDPTAATAREPRRRAALLVDDEASVRLLLARLAEDAGLAACAASDGEEALACLSSGCIPSVVVTDVAMPGIDGIALAREIRRRPELDGTWIVVHSGSPEPPGGCAEADAWVAKGGPLPEVLARVARAPARRPGLTL